MNTDIRAGMNADLRADTLIGAALAQGQAPPLTEDQRKAQELLKKTIEERGSDRITTAGLILGSPEFQRQ